MPLPKFTDELLATWVPTIAPETRAQIEALHPPAWLGPGAVLALTGRSEETEPAVYADLLALSSALDRERQQLKRDLAIAVAAIGHDGTPPPASFCRRYNLRETSS